MRAIVRIGRGLAASATLLVLLVGVPAFLVAAVGWPLPRTVPVWDDITATFTGDLPLDPTTVWKVLACVLWLAWTQVAAAAVIEGTALARGSIANPVRGLAHMQGLTGPLLSAAAVLLPGGLGDTHDGPTSPPPSAVRTLVTHVEAPAPSPPTPAVSGTTDNTPAPSATIEHTVVRRDTLWDLAERHVAPGGSNQQIAAAVQQIYDLNAGVPQPDGSSLTDASLIRPGWVLRIPATGPGMHRDDRSTAPTVTVRPGDSLWEIAEDQLGDGHRYTELVDLNTGAPQVDGSSLVDPNLIRPGWTIQLPAPPTPPPGQPDIPAPSSLPGEPHEPTATSDSTVPPTTTPATTSTPPSPESPAAPLPVPATPAPQVEGANEPRPAPPVAEDDEHDPTTGVLGVAGGLLGAGLLTAVAVRRRRRQVSRSPGNELPPLAPSAEPVLDALNSPAVDAAAAAAAALRTLASNLADCDTPPVPVLATVDGSHLDLLVDREDQSVPDGWVAVADGRIWRADLEPPDGETPSGPAALPGLVSIGRLEDGGVLLNLEAVGSIGIVGDGDAAAGLAASLTIELGLSPLTEMPTVHLVGDQLLDPGSDQMLGVERHADLATALAATEEWTSMIGQALDDTGAASTFELRCRAAEEAWPVAVIVLDAATEPDEQAVIDLAARCTERRGLAAIILGACPAGSMEVTVSSDEAHLPALGLRCQLQRIDPPAAARIDALLASADAPAAPPTEPLPLTLFEPDPIPPRAPGDEDEPRLQLRLLGPITVEGVELLPQQLAIVAFLALHPDTTGDALREAIWGGRPPTRDRFNNTINALRRALGGSELLPLSTDGRYRLRGVACDALEAEQHLAAATADPERAAAELHAALDLVTGPPLSYDTRHRRHFRWVSVGNPNQANRWERFIGDAAHDLASLALASDDVKLATWAAEQGLLASPVNETLTCDLVGAHLAAGDRRAAEAAVDAYARALEDLGIEEPLDALHDMLDDHRRAS